MWLLVFLVVCFLGFLAFGKRVGGWARRKGPAVGEAGAVCCSGLGGNGRRGYRARPQKKLSRTNTRLVFFLLSFFCGGAWGCAQDRKDKVINGSLRRGGRFASATFGKTKRFVFPDYNCCGGCFRPSTQN